MLPPKLIKGVGEMVLGAKRLRGSDLGGNGIGSEMTRLGVGGDETTKGENRGKTT